jgi:hypothetical protein
MENLKQGVAPLIYCVRNCINIEVSGKKSEPQRITSFWKKYPADEIITNIEKLELSPFIMAKPGKTILFRCELDVTHS